MSFAKKVGKILRKARQSAGLTQHELAAKVKQHKAHVSRWETGIVVPKLQTAQKLASVLGITIEELCRAPKKPYRHPCPLCGGAGH